MCPPPNVWNWPVPATAGPALMKPPLPSRIPDDSGWGWATTNFAVVSGGGGGGGGGSGGSACGPAGGVATSNTPMTDLCSTSTASNVTGIETSLWQWTCTVNGVITQCTAASNASGSGDCGLTNGTTILPRIYPTKIFAHQAPAAS